MRLILVRHGETSHNRDGFVQGRADPPLTAYGEAQAAALGDALAGITLAAVYSSPLQRAMQTAEPIARRHNLPVEPLVCLLEMDVGELDGLSGTEMRQRYPEVLAAWAAGEGGAFQLPGGESLQMVQDRAWECVQGLRVAHEDSAIVCVTHNFVALSLICRVLGLPVGQFRRVQQSLGASTWIDFRADRSQIVRLNVTCLATEPPPR